MSGNDNNKNVIKECFYQVIAATAAGTSEIVIMQPLDVIKTRLQLQTQNSSCERNGVLLLNYFLNKVKTRL